MSPCFWLRRAVVYVLMAQDVAKLHFNPAIANGYLDEDYVLLL